MDPENRFLELLTRFNRKERFYLIGMALGNRDFRLSDDFREQLAARLALPVREDSFVAMDYHLNWLYAAAHFASNGSEPLGSPHCENPLIEDGEGLRIVQSNQEDIDLVIASLQGGICHLILIEAKGVTSWSNK